MRYAFLSNQLAAILENGRHGRQGAVRRWLHPQMCSIYILVYLRAKIGAFIKKCTICLNIIGKPPHYRSKAFRKANFYHDLLVALVALCFFFIDLSSFSMTCFATTGHKSCIQNLHARTSSTTPVDAIPIRPFLAAKFLWVCSTRRCAGYHLIWHNSEYHQKIYLTP